MERRAKERLVGAVVLMAAAIIVIPEMLSGPRQEKPVRKPPAGETPLKTYTIDLNGAPGSGNLTQVVPQKEKTTPPEVLARSPPPAEAAKAEPQVVVGTAPSTAAVPDQQEGSEERKPEEKKPEEKKPEEKKPEEKKVVSPPTLRVADLPPPPPPKALVAKPVAPTSRAWAVQMGSFSKESTAQKMVSDLKERGHDAFVMPVKSGATTLYRVRVGPVAERAAAEASLRQLRALAPGATVVSQP